MRRILRKGYPFPMLAAEEASGKWVLICCACSLLKTRKGRERNGTEAKIKDGQIVVKNPLYQELPTHEITMQSGRTLYRFTGSYDGKRSLPHKVLRLIEQSPIDEENKGR